MQTKVPTYFSRQVEAAQRFHLPSRPGKGVQVESGGRERCPAFYNVDRNHFPHCVIEFISRGTGYIQLGKESWTLQPGSLYAYNRSLPHRLASFSKAGMTKYFLSLRGTGVHALLARHGVTPGHVVKVSDVGKISGIFDDMISAGSAPRLDKMNDCVAIFRYLLLKVEEHVVSSEHIVGGANSAYQKCRDFMARHYVELRSAADVAKACQIDQAYLCRLFKRFGNESPYTHLLRLRMDYASKKLGAGSISVKALSNELGFADPAAFSRAFKRTFGVSPFHSRQ